MTPVLELKDLHVTLRQHRRATELVKGGSFAVGPGECLGILGESGSGKSMSMKAAMGLLDKGFSVSGTATFQGEALLEKSGEELRRLRGGVYTQLQPGQILPGLCGAGAPEERGGTPAEKIPPVYAFRALKVHGNQGFFRMAGRQVDKVILFPAKRGSKCGKKDKKEAPDAEALIPMRPALFQPIS